MAYYFKQGQPNAGRSMTGLARVLVLLGLLVLGVALMLLRQHEHTGSSEGPSMSAGEPRVGRSTLSHGGPGADSFPEGSKRPAALDRNSHSSFPQSTER